MRSGTARATVIRWIFATMVALGTRPAVADALDLWRLPEPMLLRAQVPGLDLLPKGQLAENPWEPGVLVAQFLTSAAANVGSTLLTGELSRRPGASLDAQRQAVLTWGIVQAVVTPALGGLGVVAVGNALSPIHEHGLALPMIANYVLTLALVGTRVGLAFAGEAAAGEDLAAVLGQYAVVELVLQGVLVPVAATFLALRARDPKSMGIFGARPEALPVLALERPLRSTAGRRAEKQSDTALVASAQVPLLASTF